MTKQSAFSKDLVARKEPLTEAVLRNCINTLVEPTSSCWTLDGLATTKIVKLGEYKSLPNHVRTPEGTIHRYASPDETPAMMGDLMHWYREQIEGAELHPVVIASLFHHRFTGITRLTMEMVEWLDLLANLILMQCISRLRCFASKNEANTYLHFVEPITGNMMKLLVSMQMRSFVVRDSSARRPR